MTVRIGILTDGLLKRFLNQITKLAVLGDPYDCHLLGSSPRHLISYFLELKIKHLAFWAPASIKFDRFLAGVILKVCSGAPFA